MSNQIEITWIVPMTVLRVIRDDKGCWVQFEGSGERLYFGIEGPNWKVGEVVDVSFRRHHVQA